jgi:hypothetical protein
VDGKAQSMQDLGYKHKQAWTGISGIQALVRVSFRIKKTTRTLKLFSLTVLQLALADITL